MIKMGMMIGERYEILELIGTGGMSDVYKAKCHKLNRNVAVKVLKQEFSENKEFVSKFRTEAQAAAGLMHPNIVNVYDVGEENGIYYIVMELVEGITLKRYIEKKARLSVKEAVSIAIQISMGIKCAHDNKIIHRDIKPQNIIISKEGKVKVTDFGIAKAATSNTITSNVMGSVHYTSPEQARGGFSDEKSDIYSLGITLFEMLTGRVPFNGDTTVAIAIKHIQEEMPSPRNYVPEIPISVEQIVLKCTLKSPDRRYQKVDELIEDLKKSLISPDEDFVKIDSLEQSAITRAVTEKERAAIKSGMTMSTDAAAVSAAEAGGIALSNTGIMNQRAQGAQGVMSPRKPSSEGDALNNDANGKAANKSASKKGAESARYENKPHKKTQEPVKKTSPGKVAPKKKEAPAGEDSAVEKIKTVLIIVAAALIGLVVIYFAGLAVGIFGNGSLIQKGGKDSVAVPNVVGKSVRVATGSLEDADLVYEIEYQASDTVAANHVISTDPSANTKVKKGSTVKVKVSMQGNGAAVPNVLGKSSPEAISLLEADGFVVEKTQDFSEEVDKGNVISQTPDAQSFLERGQVVTICVSLGSESGDLTMPDLSGMTEENARKTVTDMGLEVTSVSEAYDDNIGVGLVCGQGIAPDEKVKKGMQVSLVLSQGAQPRNVDINLVVQAPPMYKGGDAVVVLRSQDGTELFNVTTASFPQAILLSQYFGPPKGTVSVAYTIYVQEEQFDEAGNSLGFAEVPAIDTYSYDVVFE